MNPPAAVLTGVVPVFPMGHAVDQQAPATAACRVHVRAWATAEISGRRPSAEFGHCARSQPSAKTELASGCVARGDTHAGQDPEACGARKARRFGVRAKRKRLQVPRLLANDTRSSVIHFGKPP